MVQLARIYQWRYGRGGRDLPSGCSQCFRCCFTHSYLTYFLAVPLHGNSQRCSCQQSSNGKFRGKSPAQTVLPSCRLYKPIYLKISSLCLTITLVTTGVKSMSSAPYDLTSPSGCFQRAHTENVAFTLLPFLQGYCRLRGKQEVSLYLKKKCCNCPNSFGCLLLLVPFCFPYGRSIVPTF